MKVFVSVCFVVMASFALAQDHCAGTASGKEKSKDKACANKVMAQDHCAGGASSKEKSKDMACANKVMTEDQKFFAMAQQMQMEAEGKKACCKSTAKKPMAKGDKGCCNEKGSAAKFKVFVSGEGYKYFGCEGSAKKGRTEWAAKGKTVGSVQKVTSRVAL